MSFSRDVRGVSEVLGAILVFALLISVLTIIQVSAVPALNEQVEFEHNAGLQDDMRGFDASVDEAAATGVNQPVVVDTGVRYPPRLFLLNPGPTAGTFSTTGDAGVTFGNLSAVNPETREYFGGDRSYTTTGVVYEPAYNQYRSAPQTRYEHGVLYNADRRSDDVAVLDAGSVVSGRRISLTMLTGNLATSDNDAVTLTVAPTSAPTTVVSVTNEASGEPVTISLRTALSETTWEEVLASEIDANPDEPNDDGRYVTDVRCVSGAAPDEPCDGQLVIEFEEGYTYDLRLAEVSVDGAGSTQEPAYVTTVPSLDREISENGGTVGAAVRDKYGNPVSGVEVAFYSPASGKFDDQTVTTDADGIATTQFNPGTTVASTTIWAGINRSSGGGNPFDNADLKDYIKYGVSVTEANEPSTAGDINPVGDDALFLREVTLTDAATRGGGGKDARYTLTFDNTGDVPIEISEARVNFYFVSNPGGAMNPASQPPTSAIVTDVSDSSREAEVIVRGGFEPFTDSNVTVPGGDDEVLQVDFYNDAGLYGNANSDDYFILTLLTDGSPRTYFVVPGLSSDSSTMASETSVGTASTTDGRLTFALANGGSASAEIESISVDNVDGNDPPTRVSNGSAPEFRIASGAMLYDNNIQIGGQTVTVTGPATIGAGLSQTFVLGTFERSNNLVQLTGRTVTITVDYTDGSSGTYTISP